MEWIQKPDTRAVLTTSTTPPKDVASTQLIILSPRYDRNFELCSTAYDGADGQHPVCTAMFPVQSVQVLHDRSESEAFKVSKRPNEIFSGIPPKVQYIRAALPRKPIRPWILAPEPEPRPKPTIHLSAHSNYTAVGGAEGKEQRGNWYIYVQTRYSELFAPHTRARRGTPAHVQILNQAPMICKGLRSSSENRRRSSQNDERGTVRARER